MVGWLSERDFSCQLVLNNLEFVSPCDPHCIEFILLLHLVSGGLISEASDLFLDDWHLVFDHVVPTPHVDSLSVYFTHILVLFLREVDGEFLNSFARLG